MGGDDETNISRFLYGPLGDMLILPVIHGYVYFGTV